MKLADMDIASKEIYLNRSCCAACRTGLDISRICPGKSSGNKSFTWIWNLEA